MAGVIPWGFPCRELLILSVSDTNPLGKATSRTIGVDKSDNPNSDLGFP